MSKYNLNNSYKAVVIGGSAGSFQGVVKILSQLPPGFPLPIIMCLHRLKHVRNGFVEALSIKSVGQVVEPNDKENIKKGSVYLAPANYHMSIELGNHFALSTEEMINNSRRSAPAVSSATSRTFTAPCSSPSCTALPTRLKHKPRSPCGKAILAHSASI